jgi:ankyrin repeat protein
MTTFFDALYDGDIDTLREQLRHDPDLANTPNTSGTTPLFHACDAQKLAIVELLLSFGADPDHADDDGETPLHVAAFTGNAELVKLLLAAKAGVAAVTAEGKTALMNAGQSGSQPTVELLLKAGADARAQDEDGRTALHWATVGDHDDPEIIRGLLAAGAEREAVNANGQTPLDYARAMKKTAIADALRSKPAPTEPSA